MDEPVAQFNLTESLVRGHLRDRMGEARCANCLARELDLPTASDIMPILATLAVLWLLGSVTDVSIYALNLTTAMGLGLSIDYSLLMVNRYREELAAGQSVADAVHRSVATAGRTILFSAATVAA